MRTFNYNLLFLLLLTLPAWSQDSSSDANATEEVMIEESVETEDSSSSMSDSDVEEVVVTGSRIKKSTFTSISPLQIISSEVSREAGLIDPADILQESTAATGRQIDTSFVGFVLDNGPGASTLSLRGLGSGRTLLLINGRRVGPGGVEGAPTSPDLNLLPGGLIQRYDLLLDGASSVYGSDAVGGVTNVILRSDSDGWEADMYLKSSPHQKGGYDDRSFTLTYGANSDRWFFGAGLEVAMYPEVKLRDRPWTKDCQTEAEITQSGEIKTVDLWYQVNRGFGPMECSYTSAAGYLSAPTLSNYGFGASTLIYDPSSGGAINGFSPYSVNGIYPDWDGDGFPDVDLETINIGARENFASLSPDLDKLSFMAYGEYILEGEGNHTIFFETQYGKRETYSIAGAYQLFPYVPANNPYNVCNPANANGIDCGAYATETNSNADYIAKFNQRFSGGSTFTTYNPVYGPLYEATYGVPSTAHTYYCGADRGNIPSFRHWLFGTPRASWYDYDCFPSSFGGETGAYLRPVVSVMGDRTEVETDVVQKRYVLGIKGDINEFVIGSNWSYEVSAYQTESVGKSFRAGIRDDRLRFGLGLDPTVLTSSNSSGILNSTIAAPCDATGLTNVRPDVLAGCVPINLFAPSLYNTVVGDFATQAERDYLFYESVFNTTYTQTVLSAFMSGTVAELPAGSVGMVVGVETRTDEIDSNPDSVRDEGLFFGFAANGGARGEQDVLEGFMELAIPLVADKFLAEELNLEVATRFTDIETTNKFNQKVQNASGSTWSAKLAYRPINDLLIRGTVGTSYRAPNLREVALRAESGYVSVSDPCNASAYIQLNESGEVAYDASLETREQTVIDNCVSAGVDPYSLGYDFVAGSAIPTSSTEIITGGSTDLGSETSKSTTFGFVYDVPVSFSEITFGASWYNIEVSDAIIEPSGAYAVYDCYYDKAGYTSSFCSKIKRSTSTGLINQIEAGFLNRDLATARGIDVNLRLSKPFTIAEQAFDLNVDISANNMIERTLQFTSDTGNPDVERYETEPGYPDWTGQFSSSLGFNDWRLAYSISYISRVDQDPDFVDTWSNTSGVLDADGNTVYSDTCNAPTLCRDIGFIKSQTTHNISLYYRGDTFTVGAGVRNAFDTPPPFVDASEISSYSNVPTGYGYRIFGQEMFFNFNKRF